jgi:hypothetical protein
VQRVKVGTGADAGAGSKRASGNKQRPLGPSKGFSK